MIPVVNYGRMARLRPPESTTIPVNANTIAIAIILVCVLGLYRRAVIIGQSRAQSDTLNTLMPTKRGLSSSIA
ncbi:hypothetical protein [Dishui Lake phycodnavirus 3]|nr:hypothetical protein [Dishui Lake phycodnavirus 3]